MLNDYVMIIREYKPKDREAVEKCIFELQEDEYKLNPDYWTTPEEATTKYLDYLLPNIEKKEGKLYVAEVDGVVKGFIAVLVNNDTYEDNGPCIKLRKFVYVTDLVVLKSDQKNGIGWDLLKVAEEYGRKIGIEYIGLHVSKDNSAIEFYQKNGYSERHISMDKKLS